MYIQMYADCCMQFMLELTDRLYCISSLDCEKLPQERTFDPSPTTQPSLGILLPFKVKGKKKQGNENGIGSN